MKKKNICLMVCGILEILNIIVVVLFLMVFIVYKRWYLCFKKKRYINLYSNKGYSLELRINDFEIVIYYIINFIYVI